MTDQNEIDRLLQELRDSGPTEAQLSEWMQECAADLDRLMLMLPTSKEIDDLIERVLRDSDADHAGERSPSS